MTGDRATRDDVLRVFGRVEDDLVAAILATGAAPEDLEVAREYAEGADDVMGEARKPLSGAAAAVYELVAEEEDDEDH